MNPQQIDEALYRAATHHQAGQLAEAAALYSRVLAVAPASAVANHNLGVLAMQTGKGLGVALPLFRAAWQADPNHQQHWLSYLRALVQSGDMATAQSVYADGGRRGLRGPDPELLRARMAPARPQPAAGAAQPAIATDLSREQAELERLLAEAKSAAAESFARALTASHPQQALGWRGLGSALVAQSRDREALAALERAAQLAPGDGDIQAQLGGVLMRQGLSREAELAYRRALATNARHAAAQRGLAAALLKMYRCADAETVARQALQSEEQASDLHLLLGEALLGLDRADDALACYREALRLRPGDVDAYRKLGALLHERRDEAGMLALARQMLVDAPQYVEAYGDLARVLMGAGRLAEAAQVFRQALQLQPNDLALRESYLFCSHYLEPHSPQIFLDEARVYGRQAREQARPFRQWNCGHAPQKLRVGLVSGDLREHPVAYFLEGPLAHADRSRIEWVVYSTNAQSDATTARLQRNVSQWRMLVGLSAEESARQIHADGVHLLIDLAGHSALNGLPVFAWRPAPVQLSWLGYFATTGLAEMDFLLADQSSVPPAERKFFTETIWDLPRTRLCFSPPEAAPAVAPTPAAANGYVTFGSFQALRKLNDEVLAAWAEILAACPHARLRVQCTELSDAGARSALLQRALRLGIGADRLALHGQQTRQQYLESHAEVDILLDTFPFPGGTTTCEALWMGVPTVTVNGTTMIGRQGARLLDAAGLGDWIADSRAGYVALATAKAADVAGLARLRAELRARLPSTALFDAPRFTRDLVDALWAIWLQRKP